MSKMIFGLISSSSLSSCSLVIKTESSVITYSDYWTGIVNLDLFSSWAEPYGNRNGTAYGPLGETSSLFDYLMLS